LFQFFFLTFFGFYFFGFLNLYFFGFIFFLVLFFWFYFFWFYFSKSFIKIKKLFLRSKNIEYKMFGCVIGSRKVDNSCVKASGGGGGGGGSGANDFDLVNYRVSATGTVWQPIASFPWSSTQQSGITTGDIVYYVQIGDRTLDIQFFDVTNAATLGIDIAVASTGIKTFNLSTVPPADALVELQIRKSAAGGISPLIKGAVLYLS